MLFFYFNHICLRILIFLLSFYPQPADSIGPVVGPSKYFEFFENPVSQLWDLIETWGFREDDPCDFPDIPILPHKKFNKPNITQPLKNGDFSQLSQKLFLRVI